MADDLGMVHLESLSRLLSSLWAEARLLMVRDEPSIFPLPDEKRDLFTTGGSKFFLVIK